MLRAIIGIAFLLMGCKHAKPPEIIYQPEVTEVRLGDELHGPIKLTARDAKRMVVTPPAGWTIEGTSVYVLKHGESAVFIPDPLHEHNLLVHKRQGK